MRTTGAVLAPMSAFQLLQGIETVALRVERHVENGRKVAEFLRADPRVDWVNYVGFADSPYHALAVKYLGGQASSLLTFGIRGGLEAGAGFYDRLKLIKRLVNIGDAKSLACHPASTTHRQMSAADQAKAGVRPEMIRLSIGIEHIDDIIEDLDQALDAAQVRALQTQPAPPPRLRGGPEPLGPTMTDAPFLTNDQRPPASSPRRRLTIALVNNMPDAAVQASERQFAGLIEEAGRGDFEVSLRLYGPADGASGPTQRWRRCAIATPASSD